MAGVSDSARASTRPQSPVSRAYLKSKNNKQNPLGIQVPGRNEDASSQPQVFFFFSLLLLFCFFSLNVCAISALLGCFSFLFPFRLKSLSLVQSAMMLVVVIALVHWLLTVSLGRGNSNAFSR